MCKQRELQPHGTKISQIAIPTRNIFRERSRIGYLTDERGSDSMSGPSIPDKRWSVDLEKRIQEEHYEQGYEDRYSFDSKSEREIFIIDTPPPYPSGTWHIGAVAQYSMIAVSYTHLPLPTTPYV